ncbi:hypothetical protein HN814_06875, partial [Candidatus Woesearchaeota archaeon]|nr:hypothetical protein [Candidatus Woesearchaeota archaeon]
ILEKIRFHKGRQPFLIGKIKTKKDLPKIKKLLIKNNFEHAILAWKDSGEILSMRKIDKKIYQYHIRIFKDLEVRAHYEFSSEGSPLGHVRESVFKPKSKFFKKLLKNYLT